MFKYFRPSTRVHQTWIQSTTKYRGLIQDCVYKTAIQDLDELKRCLTAVCADIKQCDRQSCWWVAVCPLPRDDTLNTSFAEYLAFSLIFLFFYRCPINSVVPSSRALLSEIWGHVPPPALWRRRLWVSADKNRVSVFALSLQCTCVSCFLTARRRVSSLLRPSHVTRT